jgi:hypothetical protein
MPYGVLITLTDLGSLVGPFDLYSNLDGYTTPFETNIPVSAFTYGGYYTTSLPYGTTIIKVKSDGECINFINLDIIGLPTFTPTTTSTPTVTPTKTSTPTITPSPSVTIGLTPTMTPSQTPTLTGFTAPCVCVEITATNTDPEGPAGSIEYNNCFGTLVGEIFLTTGTRYRCIDYTGGVLQIFSSTNVTYSIASGYNCASGTCPTGIVIPLTPTPTGTPTMTPTPSSTLGSTPTQTPSNTQTSTPSPSVTQTQTNTSTPTNTPTNTPSGNPYAYLDLTNGSLDIQIISVVVNGVSTTVVGGSMPNTTGNGTTLQTTQVGTYDVEVTYSTGIAGQNITLTDSDLFSYCENTSLGTNTKTFTGVKLATYRNVDINSQDGTCS